MSISIRSNFIRAARATRWLLLGGMLAAATAQANQVFTTDCAFGLKDDFGIDQIVCASGDVDTKPPGFIAVFPEGNVCVVRAGTLAVGGGIADVTAGGCNTVVGTSLGGGFFDEPIWLPPLQRGLFQVVLDEDQNGVFGGIDFAGNFFRVGDPVGANINVGAIKAAAGAQFGHWDGLAKQWHWVSDASTAIGIAWAASSGDWVSVGVGVFGAVTGIPTDYNSAILNQGGKLIEGLAAQQARRYKGLRDDPPDPLFTEFAALDLAQVNAELAADAALYPGVPLAFPFTPRGTSSFEQAQLAVTNNAALQSALVGAVTTTIERLQGAQAAGNDEYIAQQARALQGFADDLVANFGDTKQALQAYQAAQTAGGLAATTYSAAEIGALVTRINTSDLTAAEIASLTAAGFRAADISFLRARVAALAAEVPAANFTRGQTVADLITAADAGIAAFQTLSADAAAVAADREPFVILSFPTARAGGPYVGVQGAPIALSGAASTDPNRDALAFAWDFDLDGDFDDAIGAAVNYVSTAVGSTRVGLRVTDPSGRADVAYAQLRVDPANLPPVINSFAPASLAPVASSASPLAFSVAASDPEGAPLGYAWTVEGVAVGTGTSYVYAPAAGETGTRIVRVTVSDGNALSPDAAEQRVVRIETAPPVLIPVPNVVGSTQAAAEAAITAAGLVVSNVTTAYNPVVPAGSVISQLPVAGTGVAAGTPVALVVSLGPEPVLIPVPAVVGSTQAAAQAAITAAGLVVGNVTTAYSPAVPAGRVISQLPAAGTAVAGGTPVALVVSLGPEPVAMRCDADADGDIDKLDLSRISRARGQPATGPSDPRDGNGDGLITPADVQSCIRVCTRPNCATN